MFKIGDVAWEAFARRTEIQIPCPICFTKREVTLIMGNDEKVVLPCNYCAPGFQSPQGFVKDWEFVAEPRRHVITEIETKASAAGEKITYICSHYHFDHLYEKKEDAALEAKKLADKEAEDEVTKAEHIKEDKKKSFSWNAGYHLRNAKKMEKDILYHKKMAVLCKERRPYDRKEATARP